MSKDQNEHVLVIDLGTGGPKAGLVDVTGHVAACTSMPCQVFFLPVVRGIDSAVLERLRMPYWYPTHIPAWGDGPAAVGLSPAWAA